MLYSFAIKSNCNWFNLSFVISDISILLYIETFLLLAIVFLVIIIYFIVIYFLFLSLKICLYNL